MNCFDRRTLMVLSLTLSSGFSKSSAIVRPAEPALSWITLRLESFASYIHASYAGQEKSESCINKIRKNYENLLNISVYPMVILFPRIDFVRTSGPPRTEQNTSPDQLRGFKLALPTGV
jgi:hypothetical protein